MGIRSNIILTKDDIIELIKNNEEVKAEISTTAHGYKYAISLIIINKYEDYGEKPHKVFGIVYSTDTKLNRDRNHSYRLTYDSESGKIKITSVNTGFCIEEGPSSMTEKTLEVNKFIFADLDRTKIFADAVIK